jgi:hypothetical protein
MPLRTSLLAAAALAMSQAAHADANADRRQVAALDTATRPLSSATTPGMAAILHDDMIPILGVGAVITREDLKALATRRGFRWGRGTQAGASTAPTAIVPPPVAEGNPQERPILRSPPVVQRTVHARRKGGNTLWSGIDRPAPPAPD